MALKNALLIADVAHTRMHPRTNAFRYKVYYLCFALKDKASLAALRLFDLNRFNLFSFYDKDHGDDTVDSEAWARSLLKEWNITTADGDIVVQTLPRLVGYAFNPVSFWFCLDQAGLLRAVIAEVNNTFGQRHCYMVFHDDQRPIAPADWLQTDKVFHVSPFMTVEGYYRFRFTYAEDATSVFINHYSEDGRLLLTTLVSGTRQALTSASLLRCFFRYPLVTLKVIGLIHYQAIRLLLKKVHYHTCPPPPATKVSR